MPFGIEHPAPDPWQKIRDEIRGTADSCPAVVVTHNEAAVNTVEPLYQLWHVGQSKFNGRDGEPLLVACMRNTSTGKEVPVLYSRAYGLDSLVHAHGARLVEPPAGWEPPKELTAPTPEG